MDIIIHVRERFNNKEIHNLLQFHISNEWVEKNQKKKKKLS